MLEIKNLTATTSAQEGKRNAASILKGVNLNLKNGEIQIVMGSNGSGKSTLAKVITYLCYGKVEGSTLKDLPNRVNGALWGKIWLESKGNAIEIERGINPGIFNVKIN